MPKKGTAYEQVVAEVLAALDRGASVSQGQWIHGPDGMRELDVVMEGTINGIRRRIIVECKDYKPERPVGIGHIDAFESKRRDIGADIALMCSNAGFTEDAVGKARRVEIGLIAVLRKNDPRLRYEVVEELYTRHLKFDFVRIRLRSGNDDVDLNGIPIEEVKYQGIIIWGWVAERAAGLVSHNPVVQGDFVDTFRFKTPTTFQVGGRNVEATELQIEMRLTGQWHAHVAVINATEAVYNWLRRRILLPPNTRYSVDWTLNFDKGKPIARPPDVELQRTVVFEGELAAHFLRVTGLSFPAERSADLNPLVVEQDLSWEIPDCPARVFTSDGFSAAD